MPRYDFRTPRLYADAPLNFGAQVPLTREQTNYLLNVLRLERGGAVLVFNGRDGEWAATVSGTGKRDATLTIGKRLREQPPRRDLQFLFAPLKHARLDYLVQKAVEMGASRLQPIITQHTQVARVNVERMRANAVEAAEQCGVLNIADVSEPEKLDKAVAALPRQTLFVFCDEDAEVKDPVAALSAAPAHEGLAVIVGPEGGFSEPERQLLLKRANVLRLSLGPRILRADTAAVAALAVVQSVLGDWRAPSARSRASGNPVL